MPRTKSGVNKSQAIRELLQKNPKVSAKEAIDTLKTQGIKVNPSLFYFTKGKLRGRKGKRRKMHEGVVAGTNGHVAKSDALATIKSIQALAGELGGMKKLAALVEVLGGGLA